MTDNPAPRSNNNLSPGTKLFALEIILIILLVPIGLLILGSLKIIPLPNFLSNKPTPIPIPVAKVTPEPDNQHIHWELKAATASAAIPQSSWIHSFSGMGNLTENRGKFFGLIGIVTKVNGSTLVIENNDQKLTIYFDNLTMSLNIPNGVLILPSQPSPISFSAKNIEIGSKYTVSGFIDWQSHPLATMIYKSPKTEFKP